MENESTLEKEVTQETEVRAETQTAPVKAEKKTEARTYSQEEFDTNAANTRRATERETKKKLLGMLGLNVEDEDKLVAFKEAYQNSLSDEEKRSVEFQKLQEDNKKLTDELEEKNYYVKALTALTGKDENDVEKIVKMAKGLKSEENTIEQAIDEVISMIGARDTEPQVKVIENKDMPTSPSLEQPSDRIIVNTQDNPFKAGQINLTKQSQLIKNNPELAKRLAAEAGVKINF